MTQSFKFCPACGQQLALYMTHCGYCHAPQPTNHVGGSNPTMPAPLMQMTSLPVSASHVNVICPFCEFQVSLPIDESQSFQSLVCGQCSKPFMSRYVRIRSKNSRGSKKEMRRSFTIRIIEPSGAEGVIEFTNVGYDDFEIRSRDIALFSYKKNKLAIVQNLTINQYMRVRSPSCYIATYLYGPTSPEVNLLRCYRDNVLLHSSAGSLAVDWYYRVSPLLIRHLGTSHIFRQICMFLVEGLLRVVLKLELNEQKQNDSHLPIPGLPVRPSGLLQEKQAWRPSEFRPHVQ